MRSMDVPDPESDGRARTPSELFDNLRLRLSQLAENHPSALRPAETGGPGESALREPGGRPESPGAAEPAGSDEPAGADEPAGGSDKPGGDERAEAGQDVPIARPADGGGGPRGDVLADPHAGGALRDLDMGDLNLGDLDLGDLDLPGLRGASEGYRPWFMSGEPGAPWWAVPEDL
jgi:hypothetical protein